LQDGGGEGVSQGNWDHLLYAENPHKLMYSLQIVESLSRPPKFRRHSYDVSMSSHYFCQRGNVFASVCLSVGSSVTIITGQVKCFMKVFRGQIWN